MGAGLQFKNIKDFISRTSVLYTFSSVIQSIVQLVSGLLIANFIVPADYGIWNKYYLLLTYLSFLQLGANSGLNLELPLAIGRKDYSRVNLVVGSAQFFYLILLVILLFVGIVITISNPFEGKLDMYSFIGVWLVLIFTFYQNYLLATFRTNNSFRSLAQINFLQSVLNLTLTSLIVYFFIYGLILKSVITIILYVLLLHFKRPYKISLNFDWNSFKSLLMSGGPIFLLSYFQITALNFDKLIIVHFETDKSLGIYSFAYLGFSSITIFSTSLATYIYPKLSEMVGSNASGDVLWKYIKGIVPKLILILLFLAGVGAFIGPLLINHYFPNYKESNQLLKILLFAGAINGSLIGINLLLSLKKWKLIVSYYVVFIIVTILSQIISFLIFHTLESLAVGVLISNIIMVVFGYYLVYLATKNHNNI